MNRALDILGWICLYGWLPLAPLMGEPGDALPVLWLGFAPFLAVALLFRRDLI